MGSRGDIQPILALSILLQDAGHNVVFTGPPENRAWVESRSIRFSPVGADFMAFVARFPDVHSPRHAGAILRFLKGETLRQFETYPALFKGVDLVLAASLSFAAASVCEKMGIPYRFIAFCPQVFPSLHHPSVMARDHTRGRAWNRMTWRMHMILDRMVFRPMINRYRRAIRLPPLQQNGLGHMLGSYPLLAADNVLAPLPDDIALAVTRIGSLQLSRDSTLSGGMRRFLEEGMPPIYVGFGSMPQSDRRAIAAMVLGAARSLGQRVIFAFGIEKRISRDCYFVAEAAHPELFPRLSVIVHHGGAGTTATASRSGVPQILVPHILDQFYWARQVCRLGIGPKPIPRSRLNRKRIQERLTAILTNSEYRHRSRRIRKAIQSVPEVDVVAKTLS